MLVHKQIKILAKPYTDRAMIEMAGRCALGPASTPMWSNITAIFFEPGPKSPPSDFEPSELQPNNLESIQEWCENPGVQVWPVEIGPLYDGFARDGGDSHSMILLRFVDATGCSHWFDARYVSAILKRDGDPDWYYNQGRLMAKDSTPVTIAAGGTEVTIPRGDPIAILSEWNWGPNAAAAIDRYREWDPDWRLSNECTKSWHTLRWAQRLDRVLPKGKRGNEFTCHNGGSPARQVKIGNHKYIEIASENGQGSIRISLYNGEITQSQSQKVTR